jgi:hypothetical protein
MDVKSRAAGSEPVDEFVRDMDLRQRRGAEGKTPKESKDGLTPRRKARKDFKFFLFLLATLREI